MQDVITIPFELFIITAPELLHNEAAVICALLQAGNATVHIRKPGCSMQQVAALITQIPAQWYSRLVVHQHAELQQQFQLKGVHGVADKTGTGNFSLSRHHWSELTTVPAGTDYVFMSPVFNSISKQGYRANPALLQKPVVTFPFRLIALGGIEPRNIQQVIHTGWNGAAILGWLWYGTGDPVQKYQQLQQAVTTLTYAR